jgi:uncharacterized protein
MEYTGNIASTLGLKTEQVSATIDLLEDKNTIPFIARYRKESTGGLDEDQIRQVDDMLSRLRSLDERRKTVVNTIQAQGKLTPELNAQILKVGTLTALEDLYRPYKPKRYTRASVAREKGLERLAESIAKQELTNQTIETIAAPFLNDRVEDIDQALAGARDIVAEMISDHTGIRRSARAKALEWSIITAFKSPDEDDPRGVYKSYYRYKMQVNRLRPHQLLALNRGETQKVLRVNVEIADRDWRPAVEKYFPVNHRSPFSEQLLLAIEDAADRLLLPALERDVRRTLTTDAENQAMRVFASNLHALLIQPPLDGHTVLGIDPGFRTGCKVALVDPTGKVLGTATIYPHPPQKKAEQAQHALASLVREHRVTLIAIGNGTASRETEQLVADFLSQFSSPSDMPKTKYLIVNEAGASVYSASPLARTELPDHDVSIRGAISIARRVQDPLAELVKIDPRSIGVGMYQHDVNQKRLKHTLDTVVESVVNQIGVDVNTASPALLTHVAGIGPKLSTRIVAYRDKYGAFNNRDSINKVPGLGPKVFLQCAGFLRIREGDNPLDTSAIHPESYEVANGVLSQAGIKMSTPLAKRQSSLNVLKNEMSLEALAEELGTGVPTLEDIIEQLIRPGRDPRKDLPPPILRSDVLSMEDLVCGMHVKGTVRNVVDFGAFVDIGVKQDGLLHRSKIPRGTRLNIGNVITVEILNVETERNRISLGWVSNGD